MINLKIVIPIVAVLILATFFTLLATETWSPSWNPFIKISSLTIERAITKLLETESFKLTGEFQGEFKNDQYSELKSVTAVLSYSGIIDKSDKENLKTSADLNLELGMEGVIIQIKGELVSSGKDIYFRITSLPAFPVLGLELEGIKNQWVKIDREKLQEEGEEPFDKETEEAFFQELKNILAGKEIFEVKKNLGEEELDGIKVRHYFTQLNKKTLKVLIPEILQLMKKYLPEEERVTYEKDLEKFLEDFSKNFDEAWKNIEPLEFDFWTEKGDWLRRIKFEKEIKYNSTSTEDIGQVKLGIDLKFFDFNKKFEIEIPKEFKSIEEFSNLFQTPQESLPEEYLEFEPESFPEFEFSPEE